MSQWEKLIAKLRGGSPELCFDELRKILESYGYEMRQSSSGSSHYVFRKKHHKAITIPKQRFMKKAYILLVKEAIEEEEKGR